MLTFCDFRFEDRGFKALYLFCTEKTPKKRLRILLIKTGKS